jgi:hypothetical protein
MSGRDRKGRRRECVGKVRVRKCGMRERGVYRGEERVRCGEGR